MSRTGLHRGCKDHCGLAVELVLLIGLGLLTSPAFAQSALERNLPEALAPSVKALAVEQADNDGSDDTAFGIDLAGIRLIGQSEPVVPGLVQPGISFGAVQDVPAEAVVAALSPFLGLPLSLKQIAQMQAAIAAVWREAGYPFVSITVPPQEVTGGVLALRVVEFTAGVIQVDPKATVHNDGLPSNIRQQTGEPISAPQLSEDLAWLNRNPFHQVDAVFAPSNQRGVSDITLSVADAKPVSLYAGWDNGGDPATGDGRWFTGGGAWVPALNDLTLAWRFTRSSDIWNGGNLATLDPDQPGYLSLAGRIDLPTLPRQALSVAPNFVTTNELVAGTPFSFENTTFELPILYRTAVSNLLPDHYWGDVYLGIEPKWLSRQTRFFGIDVAKGEAGLINLVVGWSNQLADPYGHTSLDLRLKANPGGILDGNTTAGWNAFTGGRVDDNRYAYAGFDISRSTTLPLGLNWVSTLSGQIAGQALPDTERLGLGGSSAVRGYDGSVAVDSGVVWRNELRLPSLAPLAGAGLADQLSPFALLDLGFGRDIASATDTTLASTGLGFDYAIGRNFNAGATAAVALSTAGTIKAGDWSIAANLRLTY